MKHIQVRGLNFAYLEQGEGPLIMLLHGFPDNAQTWSHQMPALAAHGYRVIAPYLRGYPPTDLGEGGFYDKATLVADIAALIQAFGAGKPCHLVGQDWGAIIGYGVLAAYPELIARAVLMAVPHPGQVTQSLVDAKHIQRSFHWWFFQMPDLPEKALAANNLAFIDYLWNYWTTEGYQDDAHMRSVKETLTQPGVLAATLGYYRAMFDAAKADPALADLRVLMARQIKVPTLALCGGDDLRAELMQAQAQYFDSEYDFKLIANAGHFLHREQPQAVTQELLDWFKK
jgi:pimeloyl-ACP methyl ester carboxylesterase